MLAEGDYHLFISHAWKHAQDTAGTLKSALARLLPDARVFLDVDDLDDVEDLEDAARRPGGGASR